MSSYEGLQLVPNNGSQQQHYEAPIPVPHHSYEAPIAVSQDLYEKELRIRTESGGRSSSGKPILGMRRTVFWIVLAIAIVVIVAAVGGGVGGSLANKKTTPSPQPATQTSSSATQSAASRTSATSSSSTASASTPIPTTGGYTGCPGINGTIFTAASGARFMQYCNYDIVSSIELNFDDVATQNLDDCINLCDATNVRNQNTGCKALTYNYASWDYLLCWLKNGTGTLELDSLANDVGNYSVSAVLQ
ncbi:hypothetical protein N431DRAFT_550679 [Stipitochalara longipes BDJ]|nr:hypothetical protein N431DRAFT_550679 [Stipitochalara longipes BDJ]